MQKSYRSGARYQPIKILIERSFTHMCTQLITTILTKLNNIILFLQQSILLVLIGFNILIKLKTKLRGFSLQANYTDRATAACRRS
jgi:hypothetical protein